MIHIEQVIHTCIVLNISARCSTYPMPEINVLINTFSNCLSDGRYVKYEMMDTGVVFSNNKSLLEDVSIAIVTLSGGYLPS